MRELEYAVVLHPDPEVGGYSVTVPALPGVVTEGDTTEEAIAMAKDAIALYIEDLSAHGETIPVEDRALKIVKVRVAA